MRDGHHDKPQNDGAAVAVVSDLNRGEEEPEEIQGRSTGEGCVMLRRLAIAAIRANPLLTLGLAIELGYRASHALRRSTSKGRVHNTARLVEKALKPRTGRGRTKRGP